MYSKGEATNLSFFCKQKCILKNRENRFTIVIAVDIAYTLL